MANILSGIAVSVLFAGAGLASAQTDCAGRWLPGPAWGGADIQIVDAVSWDPDGEGPEPERLLCAGSFPDGSPAGASVAWRTSTGWTSIPGTFTFNGVGVFPVTAVAVYQGMPVAAGAISSVSGVPAQKVAAYSGGAWAALGSGVDVEAVVDLIEHNGELFLTGTSAGPGMTKVWKEFKWDGASWSTLPEGAGAWVRGFVKRNGELWGIGSFANQDAPGSPIARWNGTAWAPGPYAPVVASCAAVHNGLLYLGAEVGPQIPGSSASQMVWAYDGTSITYAGPPVGHYRAINSLASSGGVLYASSAFLSGDIPNGDRMERMVGTSWVGMSPGVVGEVMRMWVWGGRLMVSTWSTSNSWGVQDGVTGATATAYVAETAGNRWTLVGGGLGGHARAMTVHGGELYVGGEFAWAEGPSANVAVWDGVSFRSTCGEGGVDGGVVSLLVHNGQVHAAGSFRNASGQSARCVAYFDGVRWRQTGLGLTGRNEYACAMVEDSAGRLYVGGSFDRSGATVVNGIAVLGSGGAWQPLTSGVNGTVYSLTTVGETLYEYGGTVAGGLATQGMASWSGSAWSVAPSPLETAYAMVTYQGQPVAAVRSSGPKRLAASWTPMGNPLSHGTPPPVVCLANGRLFASGTPAGVGNTLLAVWNGTAWVPFGGGVNGAVTFVGAHHGETVVSGDFTHVGAPRVVGAPAAGTYSPRFARWTDTNAPWVARSPAARPVVTSGGTLTLTARSATGYEGVHFRWKRNGVAMEDGATGHGSTVSGATTSELTVAAVGCGDLGGYACDIYNDCGGETSPESRPVIHGCCAGDVGGVGGTQGPDGLLNNNDLVVFIDWFFNGDDRADRGSVGGVPGPDGELDNNDFVVYIDQFFAGCPW